MQIKEINEENKMEIVEFIQVNWGSPLMISRGNVHTIDQLPGYVAFDDEKIIGLITYSILEDECEIVSLDSLVENSGIGSQLLALVKKVAKEKGCKRIWLITSNDNIRAIRFYQKRGFYMKALHVHAITEARKIKPEIPLLGYDDIPILHEIEFELVMYSTSDVTVG